LFKVTGEAATVVTVAANKKVIGEPWFTDLTLKTVLNWDLYWNKCRSAFNFVGLGTLFKLSSSYRFIFLYSPIYAARLLPADILSVRDVIRCQLAYSIASPTEQWN
jgi:hypothetical protein